MIKSILDTDWYKITMAQVVFYFFRDYKVKYKFINRNKEDRFPDKFDIVLRKEIDKLAELELLDGEKAWLMKQNSMYSEFVEWFSKYRFDPSEVKIKFEGNELELEIEGDWLRTIFWEVPLLALISELFYKERGYKFQASEWSEKVLHKCHRINFPIADFGTRRRFCYEAQWWVDFSLSSFVPECVGTSNPHLAQTFNKPPVGTYAHEAIMAMQYDSWAKKVCKSSILECNSRWLDKWQKVYGKQYSVMLTDTIGTSLFLETVPHIYFRMFNGVRLDSGNPFEMGEKIIQFYKSLGINPKTKSIVWSDNLDIALAQGLYDRFKTRTIPIFGIGTHLTNDFAPKPLNIVIKLDSVFEEPVCKLSDDKGKYTGCSETIEFINRLKRDKTSIMVVK